MWVGLCLLTHFKAPVHALAVLLNGFGVREMFAQDRYERRDNSLFGQMHQN